MSLYVRVVDTGFDGTEHVGKFVGFANLLFDNPAQFQSIFSDEAEDHSETYEGTRRGLRNILRFSHASQLGDIFKKHRVSVEDVQKVIASRKAEDQGRQNILVGERERLRKEIIKKSKEKIDHDDKDGQAARIKAMSALADEYKNCVTSIALHEFDVNAVTLREHVWVHDVMMRIASRLVDFALMWERDMNYVFVAMLYKQMKGMSLTFEKGKDERPIYTSICLKLQGEEATSYYRNECLKLHETHAKSGFDRLAEQSAVRVWGGREALALQGFDILANLIEDDQQKDWFEKHFVKLDAINAFDLGAKGDGKCISLKDGREVDRRGFRNEKPTKDRYGEVCAFKGKKEIRNDIVHFNFLRERRLKLNYALNAVRSLLSYDRKLKNAVSDSFSNLLEADHVIVKWKMDQDRLCNSYVTPRLMTNLEFASRLVPESVFMTPMASVRYTSMVRALFEIDTGGNRKPKKEGAETKCKGVLFYPESFRNAHRGKIHPDILEKNYPDYVEPEGQKPSKRK
jgi:hypothetical protein